MANESPLGCLLRKLEKHIDDTNTHREKVVDALARIEERTQQHEKRMNRADRRAAGLGALTGTVGGFLGSVLRGLLFGPQGGGS